MKKLLFLYFNTFLSKCEKDYSIRIFYKGSILTDRFHFLMSDIDLLIITGIKESEELKTLVEKLYSRTRKNPISRFYIHDMDLVPEDMLDCYLSNPMRTYKSSFHSVSSDARLAKSPATSKKRQLTNYLLLLSYALLNTWRNDYLARKRPWFAPIYLFKKRRVSRKSHDILEEISRLIQIPWQRGDKTIFDYLEENLSTLQEHVPASKEKFIKINSEYLAAQYVSPGVFELMNSVGFFNLENLRNNAPGHVDKDILKDYELARYMDHYYEYKYRRGL